MSIGSNDEPSSTIIIFTLLHLLPLLFTSFYKHSWDKGRREIGKKKEKANARYCPRGTY
jgi:hypothetical protein